MQKLAVLKKGDSVELIAPASRFKENDIKNLKTLLTAWGLKVIVAENILGDDLLCANNDDKRAVLLINALKNKKTKAIICLRGGYGSLRLIPYLEKCDKVKISPKKIFVGMSDITSLNIFLLQQWQWPVIHGAALPHKFSKISIKKLKSLLFAEEQHISFSGEPMNKAATKMNQIEASLIGGNLTTIQTSIGTKWQLNSKNKILFLEEIGERAYRIDRMLEHLRQSRLIQGAKAIVFGDFLEGLEPNGSSLIAPVITRFAATLKIPVIKINDIGHGYDNFPLPLGTKTKLTLGKEIKLVCSR